MVNKSVSLWSAIPLLGPSIKTKSFSSGRTARSGTLSRSTSIGLVLVALAAMLMVVYVFGINRHAALGYELKKQQAKVNTLVEDNKNLAIRSAEVGSIFKLQEEVALNNFVQVTNQEYLQANQFSQR